jgi:hypothetical protein
METRLFHVIVICGIALSATAGCSSSRLSENAGLASLDGGTGGRDPDPLARCRLPDGKCNEHCRPLATGQCLDPCFTHTATCNPTCVKPDGSCGWPPTK